MCSHTNRFQPDEDAEHRLQEKITSLTAELEKLNPNMKAMERLESVKSRLEMTEQEFEDARAAAKAAKDAYNEVKTKRFELFDKAFKHIQESITTVYKDLTRSDAYPLGGQAYLDIEEDTDTPYLSGIKYHAMPPLKRFRDMEHLSGGEKTMAALALLFAIHSYSPSPFFVLDEVDAALDNANVEKIKKYIMDHAGPGMQFIVISLKTALFQDSESLIGVYRDQDVNSSKTLTLDVSLSRLHDNPRFITDIACSFGSMYNTLLVEGECHVTAWEFRGLESNGYVTAYMVGDP
jgi:structural maintenance of chromosome 1